MRSAGTSGKNTVLIAEGQPLLLDYLTRLLEGENYQVLSVQGSDEALFIPASTTRGLDLLVTDSKVDSATGFQIADRILRESPGIKVLMISSIPLLESAAVHRGF